MQKGCFRVYRDRENSRDIHFEQEHLDGDEVVPEEQLQLRDDVDRCLTDLQVLFRDDEEKFEEYFRPLLSLAQLGLVGDSANPSLAMRALESLKHEITSKEGGRIKNQYMIKLGKLSLALGFPPIIASVLLFVWCPSYQSLAGFLALWAGCMAGVWISFGVRKVVLGFEDLAILEEDRLSPAIRLVFAGALTVVIGLLIATNAVLLEVGDLKVNTFTADLKVALLIGVLCGISEKALSTKIVYHAGKLLGAK